MALDGHARFATLQQVSSVLHTGLTYDLDDLMVSCIGFAPT